MSERVHEIPRERVHGVKSSQRHGQLPNLIHAVAVTAEFRELRRRWTFPNAAVEGDPRSGRAAITQRNWTRRGQGGSKPRCLRPRHRVSASQSPGPIGVRLQPFCRIAVIDWDSDEMSRYQPASVCGRGRARMSQHQRLPLSVTPNRGGSDARPIWGEDLRRMREICSGPSWGKSRS